MNIHQMREHLEDDPWDWVFRLEFARALLGSGVKEDSAMGACQMWMCKNNKMADIIPFSMGTYVWMIAGHNNGPWLGCVDRYGVESQRIEIDECVLPPKIFVCLPNHSNPYAPYLTRQKAEEALCAALIQTHYPRLI